MFYTHENQSDILQAQNIPKPAPLSDADVFNSEDYKKANKGNIMFIVAEALPAIQRNLAPVGAQAAADILLPQMNAQFAQMNTQMNAQMNTLFAQMNTQMKAQFAQMNAQFAQMNAQMNTQFAQMNTQFAQMNAQMNTQFAQMNTQFAHLNNRFDHFEAVMGDSSIRIENSHATRQIDPITAIQRRIPPVLGVQPLPPPPIPVNFPTTREDLFGLNNQKLNIFLNYYGLVVSGTVSQKQCRLARFLGLPPPR